MRVAGYSSYPFHYEMIGFLIHYCRVRGYELVIYCLLGRDMGFIEMYRQVFGLHGHDLGVEFRDVRQFHLEWASGFDVYVCLTDDDPVFLSYEIPIFDKTICIEHHYKRRQSKMKHCLSFRPHMDEIAISEVKNAWIMACYPIFHQKNRYLPKTHVIILGSAKYYKTQILNRMRCIHGREIVIDCISRDAEGCKFNQDGQLRDGISLQIYRGIEMGYVIELIKNADYVITDVMAGKENYCYEGMTAVIPLAYATLTPIVLCSENNAGLRLKSVIEFDSGGHEDILLGDVSSESMRLERDELLEHTFEGLDGLVSCILGERGATEN